MTASLLARCADPSSPGDTTLIKTEYALEAGAIRITAAYRADNDTELDVPSLPLDIREDLLEQCYQHAKQNKNENK